MAIFRFANTFYNWHSYITIVDDSVSVTMQESLYSVLSVDASLSMFRLPKGYNMMLLTKNFNA